MILSQATFILKIQLPLITPQSWDIQERGLHSPPPPHPPSNIPYSWHIISIGPESCHQELWLVDIIPYYRRAPSKNIPSKRKWSRGQGLFCVGPFNIVLSFTCCLRMTRRKQKGYKNQLYNMLNFISLGRIFLRNADNKVALKLPIILQ